MRQRTRRWPTKIALTSTRPCLRRRSSARARGSGPASWSPLLNGPTTRGAGWGGVRTATANHRPQRHSHPVDRRRDTLVFSPSLLSVTSQISQAHAHTRTHNSNKPLVTQSYRSCFFLIPPFWELYIYPVTITSVKAKHNHHNVNNNDFTSTIFFDTMHNRSNPTPYLFNIYKQISAFQDMTRYRYDKGCVFLHARKYFCTFCVPCTCICFNDKYHVGP